VSFSYSGRDRDLVLEDVTLEAEQGGLVALLGPNGSGKTSLLRLLSGILSPLTGTITLDGASIGRWSRRDIARRIAVVPQETHALFDFTVQEMVLMGRYPHLGLFELESADDLEVARQALAATGTLDLQSRRFATLSGGEKQRVVIAGALAQASDVLLLDEPTASLDLGYQVEIAALLHRLNRDRGTTLVVSTHDLNLAASLCRHVVLLQRGRVLASGPTADVLTAANVRELYRVDADIQFHPRAGHLTVVPVGRIH
jgi:iron complex transport system ATP-binding protein